MEYPFELHAKVSVKGNPPKELLDDIYIEAISQLELAAGADFRIGMRGGHMTILFAPGVYSVP